MHAFFLENWNRTKDKIEGLTQIYTLNIDENVVIKNIKFRAIGNVINCTLYGWRQEDATLWLW